MNAVSQASNELSSQRIALQETFKEYNAKNGFSYEEWVSPPVGHFYEDYKKKLEAIDEQMTPSAQYQS